MNGIESKDLPVIVFLATQKKVFLELSGLAADLFPRGKAEVVFLVDPELEPIARERCEKAGFDFRSLPQNLPKLTETVSFFIGLIERIVFKTCGWSGSILLASWRYSKELYYQLNIARSILAEINPDRLVVSDGRQRNWELAFLKAARENKVSSIVPRIAFPGLADDLVKVRHSGYHFARYNKTTFKLFPGQFVLDNERNEFISYYPSYMLKPAMKLGALPPYPWVIGGNACDVVMVAGPEEKLLLEKYGADPKHLIITGQREHDTLFYNLKSKDQTRKKLITEYGFNNKAKLLVVALPQYGEHGILPWDQHWQELRFLCNTLKDTNAACLISLHPRMDPEDYFWIEKEYDFKIAHQRLVNILPAADIFIAALSSTLEWAVLCGIPSIAMDFIKFDLDYFNKFVSIKVINKHCDLEPFLKQMLNSQKLYDEAVKDQEEWRHRLSPFDGACTLRMQHAILDKSDDSEPI